MFDRRGFFKTALAAIASGPVIFSSRNAEAKTLALKIDQVPALKKVGGSVTVRMAGVHVLLVRDGENSIKAFSPICTHQACFVSYSRRKKKIQCGCHGSAFGLSDGRPIGGPATLPLPVYPATLDGDRILVKVSG